MIELLYLLATGFGVGLLSGLLGVGGGVLMTPILHLMGMPLPLAVGTTLAQMIGSSLSGSYKHWKQGHIYWPVIKKFGLANISGVIIGKVALIYVSSLSHDNSYLTIGYSAFLALIAVGIVFKEKQSKPQLPRIEMGKGAPPIPLYFASLLGIGIGVISGMSGLGGGFFYVPVFLYLFQLETTRAVASSLVIVVLTSITGTVSYALAGLVDWKTALLLACGSVAGGYVGALLTSRVGGPALKMYFAGLVGVASLATFLRYLNMSDFALFLLFASAFLVISTSICRCVRKYDA
ncbi:MAG: sulfite exporter TauE/SafE family protein [Pseudobacteriovorax sp.]|nr:sulfite exporter TauE/SafE family protein [Pseudobacteriovorax sp.]